MGDADGPLGKQFYARVMKYVPTIHHEGQLDRRRHDGRATSPEPWSSEGPFN